jgi:transposase InsO family protein
VFIPWAERQTGNKVVAFRSDRGTEFCNQHMSSCLLAEGIEHRTYMPYTAQQNSSAKCSNQTVLAKTQCLLFDGKFPTMFWGEAMKTAVFLLNRTPRRNLKNNTPLC